MASNVSLIISAAPFFHRPADPSGQQGRGQAAPRFFVGFALAMAGIALISLNSTQLSLNPLGDLLALLAALMWAVYGVATRHIGTYGHSTVQTTRRIFFYGLLFMIPALFWMDFHPDWPLLLRPINWGNLLFLGLGASALCFAAWNFAVKSRRHCAHHCLHLHDPGGHRGGLRPAAGRAGHLFVRSGCIAHSDGSVSVGTA